MAPRDYARARARSVPAPSAAEAARARRRNRSQRHLLRLDSARRTVLRASLPRACVRKPSATSCFRLTAVLMTSDTLGRRESALEPPRALRSRRHRERHPHRLVRRIRQGTARARPRRTVGLGSLGRFREALRGGRVGDNCELAAPNDGHSSRAVEPLPSRPSPHGGSPSSRETSRSSSSSSRRRQGTT
jgi:hypothetical protein